jgi:hypothetical protein
VKIVKAGCLYFALVFAGGFVLAPVRLLWVVPHLGTRTAELLEMPIMLLVTILGAKWVIRRLAVPSTPASRLGMGTTALALLLTAEFGLVLRLRRLSLSEYFAGRDPVSGTVYGAMLVLVAIVPRLVAYAGAPSAPTARGTGRGTN